MGIGGVRFKLLNYPSPHNANIKKSFSLYQLMICELKWWVLVLGPRYIFAVPYHNTHIWWPRPPHSSSWKVGVIWIFIGFYWHLFVYGKSLIFGLNLHYLQKWVIMYHLTVWRICPKPISSKPYPSPSPSAPCHYQKPVPGTVFMFTGSSGRSDRYFRQESFRQICRCSCPVCVVSEGLEVLAPTSGTSALKRPL